jgi:hypothetical protein
MRDIKGYTKAQLIGYVRHLEGELVKARGAQLPLALPATDNMTYKVAAAHARAMATSTGVSHRPVRLDTGFYAVERCN